ncbi:transposase [Streptomyces sp. NPDC005708]|uniref:transposase n=1 Tax=Streptomyces sp. NPDC005708 TaxID=3154564 RepID=UPI0033FCE1D6
MVLLRKVADRVGLTRALAAALPGGAGPGWRDRGMVLVQLACAIALGATSVLGAVQLQYQWRALFPKPVPDRTLRRALEAIDGPVAARVERVRAVIRRLVWTWLALRAAGFPWISVCGRQLTGWYVLDLDATVVACTSRKEGAAGTFKGTWGHHPLGAWVANTRECVAMLLRPGNAAANDVADHKTVLATALRQLPLRLWSPCCEGSPRSPRPRTTRPPSSHQTFFSASGAPSKRTTNPTKNRAITSARSSWLDPATTTHPLKPLPDSAQLDTRSRDLTSSAGDDPPRYHRLSEWKGLINHGLQVCRQIR